MIKLGFVDLDTSHPEAYLPLLAELGEVQVTAVYDSGDVHPQGYASQFAAKHTIPIAAKDPSELIGQVDAVMILGVDWDAHKKRAEPFLKAGIPVYIDKPVVGQLADAYALEELSISTKTPLMGGSAVRYDLDVLKLKQAVDAWQTVDSVFASGPNDFYFYGSHTVELLQAVVDKKCLSVRACGRARELFEIVYQDGPIAWLQLESGRPFFLAAFSRQHPAESVAVDGTKRHTALLNAFITMARTKEPPVPFAKTIETQRLLNTVEAARGRSRTVYLDELDIDDAPSGRDYVIEYAAQKRRAAQ